MGPDDWTAAPSPRIWVYMPGSAPWSFKLAASRTLVGRGEDCDVCLDDHTVSWNHLEFERHGEAVVATDLGSKNGTLVNGRPLAGPAPVRGGDVLMLGSVRLQVARQPLSARPGTVRIDAAAVTLTEDQRELARALAAPFRAPGAVAVRPPTRAELAEQLHLSERTVQRRIDALARTVGLRGDEGRERPLLLARRIIELGVDNER